ncbi:hypothetical protein K0819_12790 [Vibrio parahaemolyticus]|uniref:nucleoid-associated protein n=1 Tax=Vibrio parahaemolyticus TaxID=670 RepID=UPI00234A87F8|nr:nucleoid-associated protein [Vibrio parahaemolyticus]WCM64908.1 hypothetical protein K0819_12790 [Vibrio parahaemolyticus]
MTDSALELDNTTVIDSDAQEEEATTIAQQEEEQEALENEKFAQMIEEIHLFDLDEDSSYTKSNVELTDKPDLNAFLVKLCRHTYGSKSSRGYKFVEDSKVALYIDTVVKSPEKWPLFAEKIAFALTKAEKKPSFEIKEGTFVIARANINERDVIIMSKLDLETYYSRTTYEKEKGLPEEKGILKSCVIFINEDGLRDEEIRLSDKNGNIANFWYEKFLDAEPLQKDDINTKKAYTLIKQVITTVCADCKEDMYGLIESLNSYFTTKKTFDFDVFLNDNIKSFNFEKVDVEKVSEALIRLKDRNKFDGQFSIELKTIKKDIKNIVQLDDGMTLQSEGNIRDKVFKTKLEGKNYLLVRTDTGLDGFKERKISSK